MPACRISVYIICSSAVYGGTFNLFGVTMKKLGIDCTFVDPDDTFENLAKAFRPNTKFPLFWAPSRLEYKQFLLCNFSNPL